MIHIVGLFEIIFPSVVRTGIEPVCHLWFSLPFTVATVPQAFCHSCMMSAYVYHTISTLRVNVRVYQFRHLTRTRTVENTTFRCNKTLTPELLLSVVKTGFEPVIVSISTPVKAETPLL